MSRKWDTRVWVRPAPTHLLTRKWCWAVGTQYKPVGLTPLRLLNNLVVLHIKAVWRPRRGQLRLINRRCYP